MATLTERLAIIVDANVSGFTKAMRGVSDDTKKFGKGLDRVQTQAQGLGGRLAQFGRTAGIGLAGLGVAAVAFADDFVRAAEESNKVTAQTEAVLESTGAAANVTAGQVAKLSEQLSLKAGIDDELIQSGANVLLTFTKVRNEVGKGNDVFDQATSLALDMSVALGQDLQSSITLVGKALNDPVRGLTALTRAGVQFTDQQKAQIAALVESGDILGAQKIILAELSTQFSGSAEAQATASDRLKVAFGNLQETIGEKLLPAVEAFSTWMTETGIPAIEALIGFIERNQTAFLALAAVVGGALVAAFGAWAVSVIIATGPILAIGAAVALVATLVVVHFDTIRNAFASAFNWVAEHWPLLLAILTGPIGIAAAVIVKHWGTIRDTAAAVVAAIGSFFRGLPGRIAGAIGTIPTIIARAMARAANAVSDWVSDIVHAILSIPSRIAGVGGRITSAIKRGIGNIDLSPGFDIPGVPFLQHGGIVRRPTLAVIGEAGPEAVIPLSGHTVPASSGSGVGGGVVVHVDMRGAVVADQQQFEKMVTYAWNKATRAGTLNIRTSAVKS